SCVAGVNPAVTPIVVGTLIWEAAKFATARFASDVAIASSSRGPAMAKGTAPVVIGMIVESPAASVTLFTARLDTSAPGPARLRSNVSDTVPVLVTYSENVVPGAPENGLRKTETPLATTVSVPLTVAV